MKIVEVKNTQLILKYQMNNSNIEQLKIGENINKMSWL